MKQLHKTCISILLDQISHYATTPVKSITRMASIDRLNNELNELKSVWKELTEPDLRNYLDMSRASPLNP